MDESDLEPEEALARLGVDQLGALGGEPLELGLHVVDLVGNVVHAGPSVGQEPAHRCLVAERREQLDTAGTNEHRSGLDSLVVDLSAVLELGAEETLVRVDGLVEVVNSDAEMVDAAGDHGSDAIGRSGREAAPSGICAPGIRSCGFRACDS
jgi:hypothetical protein